MAVIERGIFSLDNENYFSGGNIIRGRLVYFAGSRIFFTHSNWKNTQWLRNKKTFFVLHYHKLLVHFHVGQITRERHPKKTFFPTFLFLLLLLLLLPLQSWHSGGAAKKRENFFITARSFDGEVSLYPPNLHYTVVPHTRKRFFFW